LNDRFLRLFRLRNDGDLAGLEDFDDPRPTLVLTQPHLVEQFALEAQTFSPAFLVYTYGSYSSQNTGGIPRITEPLTRDHKMFDPTNNNNARVIVVSSYSTFAYRNGPQATLRFNREVRFRNEDGTYDEEAAKEYMFDYPTLMGKEPYRAPHHLDGLFSEVVLDEAQNTKGLLFEPRCLFLTTVSFCRCTDSCSAASASQLLETHKNLENGMGRVLGICSQGTLSALGHRFPRAERPLWPLPLAVLLLFLVGIDDCCRGRFPRAERYPSFPSRLIPSLIVLFSFLCRFPL
jgi:hypothetical protein